MELNIKVTAFLLSVPVIALLLAFFVLSAGINSDIMPKIEDRYLKEADRLMFSADVFLHGAYKDLSELSNNPIIKNEGSAQDSIRSELLKLKNGRNYFKSISFFDLNEIKLADTENLGLEIKKDLSKFKSDFSAKKKYSFQYSQSSTADEPLIDAAFLVENQGLPVGFIVAKVSIKDIKSSFDASEGSAALLDRSGNIILASNPLYNQEKNLMDMNSVKMGAEGKFGTLYEYNPYLKNDVFTAVASEKSYEDFEGSQWFLVYSVDKDIVLSPITSLNNGFILIFPIIIILAILSSFLLSKEIKKPLKELEKAAKDIMSGKEAKIPSAAREEVGSLADYFGKMIKDLNESRKVIEEYSKTLEHKVGARTKDIEETKHALVSTLDEVSTAKERLKKSYSKLKDLDKEKDRFISLAAHELKTPLSAIHGFSDILLNKSVDIPKKKEYLSIIFKESSRLSQLVTDILDLSRIDLGTVKYDLKDTNPIPLITGAAGSIELEMKKKGLKFETDIAKKLPRVVIDEDKFTQVLVNLLTNAMKYTLKGKVTLKAFEEKGSLHMIFEDTGIGMSKESMKKLFHRFYRIETEITKSISGTGLGLALCKEYLEVMNGKIWVESEPGKGSKFHVTIPGK